MDLEQEFNRRIAALHGLGSPSGDRPHREGNTMDIRHEEFQAMADVFLGEDYDREKLEQVEKLQIALHVKQGELYKQYSKEELSPEGYVDSFNTLVADMFAKCEEILGPQDFLKIFGAPDEIGGVIDKETFLRAHRSRAHENPSPS